MASCLVTGADGFLGRYLLAALEKSGHGTLGVDREISNGVKADIRDTGAIESALREREVEWIFHLAGIFSAENEADLYATNILGTLSVLDAAAVARPDARVILVASSAVYGDGSGNAKEIDEETCFAPVTPYGVSKAASDLMGFQRFIETGMHVIRARPFNLVGPAQPGTFFCSSVAKQFAAIERDGPGAEIKVGDLSASRDFVDVRDVASALVALAELAPAGEAYNICSGRATPLTEIMDHYLSRSKKAVHVRTNAVNQTGRRNVRAQAGSFKKINALTGWTPSIPLEQSLDDMLNYWRGKTQ